MKAFFSCIGLAVLLFLLLTVAHIHAFAQQSLPEIGRYQIIQAEWESTNMLAVDRGKPSMNRTLVKFDTATGKAWSLAAMCGPVAQTGKMVCAQQWFEIEYRMETDEKGALKTFQPGPIK